jgi:hypothetical protein
MPVRVTVDLSIDAQDKHFEQMRAAASYLTDDKSRVQVSHPSDDPKKLLAEFTVPKARQIDVVDWIGRKFWIVEDYQTCSICFPQPFRRRRRRRRSLATSNRTRPERHGP